MPADHTIRLRDPWQVEPTQTGGRRFRRRFGWAAALDQGQRLMLVIGEATAAGQLWLNDVSLGAFFPASLPATFDVSTLVEPRNEVVIEVESGRVGAVRLEVHNNINPNLQPGVTP